MRIQFRKFNRVQAVLFLLVPALVFIIGALILEGNFVSQASAAVANSPEPPLQKNIDFFRLFQHTCFDQEFI